MNNIYEELTFEYIYISLEKWKKHGFWRPTELWGINQKTYT